MHEQVNSEEQNILAEMGAWVTEHTQVCRVSGDTLEVAMTEKDSLGETIYCFVQKNENDYRIGDDSRTLFKIDPGASDEEIYELTSELATAAGFQFDQTSGEIWKQTDKEHLVEVIMAIAQLIVAVSYLG